MLRNKIATVFRYGYSVPHVFFPLEFVSCASFFYITSGISSAEWLKFSAARYFPRLVTPEFAGFVGCSISGGIFWCPSVKLDVRG